MISEQDREALAWRTIAEVGALARQARELGMDTMSYLLDMVALEAHRYVATDASDNPQS